MPTNITDHATATTASGFAAGGGIVTTDFGAFGFDAGYSVVQQPDGKLLVAGATDHGTDLSDFDIAVARYNSDGTGSLGSQ